jgi:hypothetical protein
MEIPTLINLIRCQSDLGDYVCPCGGVAMSGGDGTNSSIQVHVVRHAWASTVTSYLD